LEKKNEEVGNKTALDKWGTVVGGVLGLVLGFGVGVFVWGGGGGGWGLRNGGVERVLTADPGKSTIPHQPPTQKGMEERVRKLASQK